MPSVGPETRNLSEQDMRFASWWVQHQLELRRLGFILLISLNAIFWGYAAWVMVDAYAISFASERLIPRRIALNNQRLAELESDRPQDLSTEDVNTFILPDGRIDAIAEVLNPNTQWWAEVSYRFSVSGDTAPLRTTFILPGQTGYLTELGYAPASRGSRTAEVEMENVHWHRIDPSMVGSDFEAFIAERFDLSIEKLAYSSDVIIGTTRLGESSFELVNNSAYGFWNMDVLVRAYRGSALAGVNKITISQVKPGERRPIQMTWTNAPIGVTRTEVIPLVNIYERASYLKAEYF